MEGKKPIKLYALEAGTGRSRTFWTTQEFFFAAIGLNGFFSFTGSGSESGFDTTVQYVKLTLSYFFIQLSGKIIFEIAIIFTLLFYRNSIISPVGTRSHSVLRKCRIRIALKTDHDE